MTKKEQGIMNECYNSDCYMYINEAIVIDKFKNAVNAIKAKFKNAKTKSDKAEAKAEAAELAKDIKKSSISNAVKKTLLIGLTALMTGTAFAQSGRDVADFYNSDDTNIEIDYEGTGSLIEPTKNELITDAKYIATALKGANIPNIDIESVHIDGEDTFEQSSVYNFEDGITIRVNLDDSIFIYDNGVLIRQYDSSGPMDLLLDIAGQF